MKRKSWIIAGLLILLSAPVVFGKSSILVFIVDMYDQKNVKPQEEGSMMIFPLHSVTTDGRLMEDPAAAPDWFAKEMDPASTTKNPYPATSESLENGEQKFNTFCRGCHGDGRTVNDMGTAKSKVNAKGMFAPAILLMTPGFSDGYIYHKIKYASGAVMPPLGYATTDKERWDIINYIRQMEKQQ